MTVNLIFTGVGGQGTLLCGKILGHILMEQGYDFKASEVHGMSRRGGGVAVYVRYGEKVYSPVVELGTADYIVAFEQMEALRSLPYLRSTGQLLVNRQYIVPVGSGALSTVQCEAALYASGASLLLVDAVDIAAACGNICAFNAVLLGALARRLGLSEQAFYRAMEIFVKPSLRTVNQEAFAKGYAL